MSTRPKVLVLDSAIHHDAINMLQEECEVALFPAGASEEDVLPCCGAAVAFLVRSWNVTRRILEASPRLRIIARHGSGVDNVDVSGATERGVVVTITGAANSTAVSEFTFALMLGLCRLVPAADRSMKGREWAREAFIGVELEDKTLGIIGLGNIGTRVARHGRGFGMHVLAYDPDLSAEDIVARGAQPASLQDVFTQADFVSLHPRLTTATFHMIDAEAIGTMKKGVRIINTSRGPVIDEAALVKGLQTGRIAGAALDTFEEEPLSPGHPLRAFPNVLLSPHIAGQTEESLKRMATGAARAILDELDGKTPVHIYNPEALQNRRLD